MGLLLAFIARLITGTQGHWKGCPPKAEQRIYFANHQSHLDWVLIWAALPRELRARTRPIAARDYWTSSPFKRRLTSAVFNAVYISRTRVEDQDKRFEIDRLCGASAGQPRHAGPEGRRTGGQRYARRRAGGHPVHHTSPSASSTRCASPTCRVMSRFQNPRQPAARSSTR